MIRLFISDFDGTLLDHTHTINEISKQAIIDLRRSGVSFMPASGRDYMMIMNEMDKVDLHPKCIALNGGEFYDNDGTLKISNPLPKKQLLEIADMIYGNDVEAVYFTEDGRMINADPSMKDKLLRQKLDKRNYKDEADRLNLFKILNKIYQQTLFEPDLEKILSKMIIKVDIAFQSMNLRGDFWNRLMQIDGIVTTSSSANNLEINSIKATKGHMAMKICQMYGYEKEEVVVIGDSINDISMLSMFPNSYAMGNASDEVKQYASYTTASNMDNGVAKVMYEIIEQNKKCLNSYKDIKE